MTDHDRDPEPPIRETERTTIIHDTGDRGGGGGGILLGLVAVLIVLAILFFLFRGSFMGAPEDRGVHVNVAAPTLKVPDINVKVPDVKVSIPKVDVKTEDSGGNKATAK
jgi:uncharacterized membrane protein